MIAWNAAFDSDQSGPVPAASCSLKREPAMPIANMLILTGIVLAFVFFAGLLAWGDYQTRLVGRAAGQTAGQTARATAQIHSLQQVAEAASRKGPTTANAANPAAPQPADRAINQPG
jgi:hypothetical protein